jgi:hypothetical protein
MTCEALRWRDFQFLDQKTDLTVLGFGFARTNMIHSMAARFLNPVTNQIAGFLTEIGLEVCAGEIPGQTFLPGIHVTRGALVIDEATLAHPGDLLHEAGHLAVTSAARRNSIDGDTGEDGGEEMAAIAWSYAAAVHLGLPPGELFHAAGYRGDSASLIENFEAGRYVGVSLLKWIGLTSDAYPEMTRWLRD